MTLTPFTYGDQPVRVVTIDGQPWFVLADLARVLDITDVSRLNSRLDDGVRLTHPIIDSLGRTQQATIVSEPGMYEVVIRSDKPEATAFRRWITTEVLPSIRKHGGYLTPEATEAALTDPDFIIRLATALKDERAAREAIEATATEQRARLRLVEPKAAAFDRWMGSGAEYAIDVAAKALSASGYLTGRNRLFDELAEIGWAYRDASGWHPYQQHGPEGTKRLSVRVFYYDHPETGEAKGKATLKITAKGIADLAKRHGILPEIVHEALREESAA